MNTAGDFSILFDYMFLQFQVWIRLNDITVGISNIREDFWAQVKNIKLQFTVCKYEFLMSRYKMQLHYVVKLVLTSAA